MKTKLTLIAVVLMLLPSVLQAQIQVGVLGGVNFQNINGKDMGGDKLENGLLVAFHGGANVNIPVAPDFYLQPGLLFSIKGSHNDFGPIATKAASDYPTTTKLSYIEMPVNLLFRPQFGSGHILLGFGPYVALGVGGSQKSDVRDQEIEYTNSLTESEYTTEKAYFRPLDAGANIFFGYEMSMGLFLQFNAQLGLLKINPEYVGLSGDESLYKNTGFGLSAGFRF